MNRLIANLSSFITSYKRDDTDATLVGNFSLDTDWSTFVFSWSNDRSNNRTITSGTVISDIPNLSGVEWLMSLSPQMSPRELRLRKVADYTAYDLLRVAFRMI